MDSDDISDELYSSDTPMDYDFMANEEIVDLGHDVDDDDDVDDEDHGFPDPIIGYKHENYIILKEEDVKKRLEDHISKVSSVLSVSTAEASLMLLHFNWNVDAVHEAWFSDEEKVRKAVGLMAVAASSPLLSSSSSASGDVKELVGCGICFDGYDSDMVESLACGHLFCVLCWKGYISTSIHDGVGCLTLKCPMPKCGVSVGKDMVEKFASESDFQKYQQYFVRSYVEGNKKIKWCPAPGCETAIEYVAGTGNYDVTCSCSHSFCWNCTDEIHRPVDCETVAIWNEKNNNESENANWILAFTKPCPKCKRPIEKNHGCMHMTCRPPCGYEFCWTCMGDYRSHGICNRYEGRTNEGVLIDEDEMKRRKAKNMLERYMHYYERWVANLSSRDKARADLDKMQSVHLNKLSVKHCQTDEQLKFIVEAWRQIIECRRVLKWTYAYGYYLPEEEGTKKRFFEYLQGEAEAGLERLHRCAEKELEHYLEEGAAPREDFNEYRTKLIGLTRATRTYFENLVRALENGLADVDSEDSPGHSKKGNKGNVAAESKRKRRTDGKRKRGSSTGGSSGNYVTIISSDDE